MALRLSLDALQVLDAIARRGSFAAAADEIHRTTSTLSYTVRKLEDDLGLRVFDRSGHRAVLTAQGRLLLEEGRALLDAAAAVERRVRSLAKGWEASLTIAVNDVVPIERVLQAVGEFYALGHPTRIRIETHTLGGVLEALGAQRADLAIAEVPGGDALEFSHRPIGAVSFVFAVAPTHALAGVRQPVKADDIRRHRVVVVADTARSTPPRSSGIASGADVLTVSSMGAKLLAQVEGLGVGFLPVALAAASIEQGRLVRLRVTAPKPRLDLNVVWRTADPGPAARWFIERLQALALD